MSDKSSPSALERRSRATKLMALLLLILAAVPILFLIVNDDDPAEATPTSEAAHTQIRADMHASLQACQEQAAQRGSTFRGEVSVELTLAPDGLIKNVTLQPTVVRDGQDAWKAFKTCALPGLGSRSYLAPGGASSTVFAETFTAE